MTKIPDKKYRRKAELNFFPIDMSSILKNDSVKIQENLSSLISAHPARS
jgi:hypothetical protein